MPSQPIQGSHAPQSAGVSKNAAGSPRARTAPLRQRQRLIDACISALHIHGPSRTTVEKVVAIAKMSPGIVRFYFDSKAAMLVASLQFLAAEFEEQVLVPVARQRATPVAALKLLVDLYLDPVIASPRKVSVWYAFWGEASSRQEYYDICGQKDESFAALVRELIATLVTETRQTHLEPDGIALGLIGVLEILWQDFAFQSERDIDRPAAKERCMAYLRSVFPGRFSDVHPGATHPPGAPSRMPAWAYANPQIYALERDLLLQPAWTFAGHESQIPRSGEFVSLDAGSERVLLVRGPAGRVHALRNSCPESPHALVGSGAGRFDGTIECTAHRLKFGLDGRALRPAVDLAALDLCIVGGLMFVRAPAALRIADAADVADAPGSWFDQAPPAGLMLMAAPFEAAVAADWKLLVEQWLELAGGAVSNPTPLRQGGWSSHRYRHLLACAPDRAWRRQFMAPNQFMERRPDGLSVVQALALGPGRCLVRRFDYTVLAPDDGARAAQYLAQRLSPFTRRGTLERAQSAQSGLLRFGYETAAAIPDAVSWFRGLLISRVRALASEYPPGV
jgi:TetR/AcrR family transcriptional repressor of bet genes